eukprot:3040496-Amphidinium_carterae.1
MNLGHSYSRDSRQNLRWHLSRHLLFCYNPMSLNALQVAPQLLRHIDNPNQNQTWAACGLTGVDKNVMIWDVFTGTFRCMQQRAGIRHSCSQDLRIGAHLS